MQISIEASVDHWLFVVNCKVAQSTDLMAGLARFKLRIFSQVLTSLRSRIVKSRLVLICALAETAKGVIVQHPWNHLMQLKVDVIARALGD